MIRADLPKGNETATSKVSITGGHTLHVFQAIYGERDRGHGLLRSSPGDAPFGEIASLTDRPEGASGEIPWEPFVRAFNRKSWYVLARTFPDVRASRTGMVFTHALLARANEIASVTSLGALISHLMGDVDRERPLEVISIDVERTDELLVQPPASAPCVDLARALISTPKLPVVWLGQDGFTDVICELWKYLWPSSKLSLQFCLSFAPYDIEGQSNAVVTTPRTFVSRWTGYSIVDPSKLHEAELFPQQVKTALSYIFDTDRRGAVKDLLTDLDVGSIGFGEVSLAARVTSLPAYPAFAAGSVIDAETLRSIARVAGKLSPDASAGSGLKGRLIENLSALTASGSDEDVVALRNFDLSPFPAGAERLQLALVDWFDADLSRTRLPGVSTRAVDAGRVLLLAATGGGIWAEAVTYAVGNVLAKRPILEHRVAQRLWDWMNTGPAVVALVAPHLSSMTGSSLARTCPSTIAPAIAQAVLTEIAVPREWDTVAAAVLAASTNPPAAYSALRRLSKLATRDAYATIAQRVPARDTLKQALRGEDTILLLVAGELCADHPELMADLAPDDASWLVIWEAYARSTRDVWRDIADPREVMQRLWSAVLMGASPPIGLLVAIAKSEHGSVLDHPRRAELWNGMPPVVRESFVAATATDWLRKMLNGARLELPDAGSETTLRSAIMDETRAESVLQDSDASFESIVQLFESVPQFSESLFRRWFNRRAACAALGSAVTARSLGVLIRNRTWRDAATDIARLARSAQPALRPAAEECVHLVPLWIRLTFWTWLPQLARSEGEIWTAVVEIASELYPWGPGERDVWQRAGGDPSLLPKKNSGRASWQAAVGLMRRGGGGEHLSLRGLLACMRDDFPHNERLRTLQSVVNSI